MAGRRSSGYAEEREDLLLRLRRMEGQVRGLQQMIQDDRYCLDVIQQINGLSAAGREVSVLVLESHLRSCVQDAVRENDGEAAIKEMVTVLRRTLRP